jgi:RimJ/RimL family protein N-acetyltransferase
MIVPEYRNMGLGKKALWDLLSIAFNDFNMNQVYSDVFETNCALEKYLKWGFKEYGLLPNWYYKNGKYINSRIIAITKDEYNSLKQTLSEQQCVEPGRINVTPDILYTY